MNAQELSAALQQSANEIMEFAASKENCGPFAEEIYRTNVQIASALTLAASRISRAANEDAGA